MISAMLLSFLVLLIIGVPLGFCLVLSSAFFILTNSGSLPLEVVPQRMMVGIDVFTFLAIPLFLLAGELMNVGGITVRLVRFAQGVIGYVKGGLAYVTVLTNMLMAGISGSALADAAGTGSVLINSMEKAGYRKGFSAALVSASSTIGPIIPPSIPFVIYAIIANVSVGKMFMAGAIPGILMGLALMGIIGMIAKKQNFPKEERMPFKEIIRVFFSAIFALLMPVIILGGILTGVFTATESACVAVVYAFLVSKFVYKELNIYEVPRILLSTAKNTAVIMFIVAAAALFGWILAHAQVPQMLTNAVTSITSNPFLILVVINLLLLFLGCFMEGTAILILLAPVLLPLVENIGVDPIQFGVIMVLNLMVGLITPPVGMTLFISSRIANISVSSVIKEIVPFILAIGFVLILVTFIPFLSLWLPSVLVK